MRGLGKDVFLASLVPSEEELEQCPVTFRPAIALFLCFVDQGRLSDSFDPVEGGNLLMRCRAHYGALYFSSAGSVTFSGAQPAPGCPKGQRK